MRPEEVPGEWVDAAELALADRCNDEHEGGRDWCGCPDEGDVRLVLATVPDPALSAPPEPADPKPPLPLGEHMRRSVAMYPEGYPLRRNVERFADRADALERERDEAVSRYHLEVAARRRVEGELAEMTRTARSMSSSARRALIARMDAQ